MEEPREKKIEKAESHGEKPESGKRSVVAEGEKGKERKNKKFYLSFGDVNKAFLSKKPLLVMIYKDVYLNDQANPNELELPSSISSLLQDFDDIFPEEIPNGLPPIRGIEHQIDFVPGAAIPNRPAYRSNPEETKELQRQVSELLDKGYI